MNPVQISINSHKFTFGYSYLPETSLSVRPGLYFLLSGVESLITCSRLSANTQFSFLSIFPYRRIWDCKNVWVNLPSYRNPRASVVVWAVRPGRLPAPPLSLRTGRPRDGEGHLLGLPRQRVPEHNTSLLECVVWVT